MARFEMRFQGKDNAGLRQKIRERVKAYDEGRTTYENRYQAIMAIRHSVALTGLGLAVLANVAQDYLNLDSKQ